MSIFFITSFFVIPTSVMLPGIAFFVWVSRAEMGTLSGVETVQWMPRRSKASEPLYNMWKPLKFDIISNVCSCQELYNVRVARLRGVMSSRSSAMTLNELKIDANDSLTVALVA